MRSQKIRAKPRIAAGSDFELSGWLNGRLTYLWFGTKERGCMGFIDGRKLYRLAKAIVRHFEEDRRA